MADYGFVETSAKQDSRNMMVLARIAARRLAPRRRTTPTLAPAAAEAAAAEPDENPTDPNNQN